MRKQYSNNQESNGLKLASTYYPPQTNSFNTWGDNLKEKLKKDVKPISEMQKELEENLEMSN